MNSTLTHDLIATQNARALAASVGLADDLVVFWDSPDGRVYGLCRVGAGAVLVLTSGERRYEAVHFTGPIRTPGTVWKAATAERLGPEAFEAAMAAASVHRGRPGTGITVSVVKQDEHGIWRDGNSFWFATDADLVGLDFITDWQGAEDLPVGCEFCFALHPNGNRLRLYRQTGE